jgi:pimeloyl-ACP methyl ester carboxylesterase
MAVHDHDDGLTLAIPERRPRALKDIGYNSLIYDTPNTSSGEDLSDFEGGGIPAQDARRVFDVCLGPEQSRLTSPKTPAPEKAAVIEAAGGFFGDGADDTQRDLAEEDGEDDDDDGSGQPTQNGAHAHDAIPVSRPLDAGDPIEWRQVEADAAEARAQGSRETTVSTQPKAAVRLPSPWRAVPRNFQRSDQTRQFLRDGLRFSRRRSSGSDTASGWRGALSNLPNFSLTASFSSSQHDGANEADNEARRLKRSSRSGSFLANSFQWPSRSSMNHTNPETSPKRERSSSYARRIRRVSSPSDPEDGNGTVGELPSRPQLASLRSRKTYLRRSASDDSLTTARTMSRASSLGDDTRFADVSAQVNNRLKAFKDSWADSSVKLPSMPSMASLTPDFIRERASSVTRKPTSNGTRERTQSAADMRLPQDDKSSHPQSSQPNPTRSATGDSKFEFTHPQMHKALSQLEGDIVILGGYRGSILRSAQPPHRQLWAPVKVGLNIRKVDLEVGLEPGDDERATEKVIPGGMLTHIGPVDIAKRLFKRLRNCENARSGKLRVHDYGYDWRLDPAYLSKQLQDFLKTLPSNQPGVPKEKRGATVIAHSLGGLITRHAVNQQPTLFAGVIYAGVPRTCVNILGPLRNGDDVLLSSRVLTAQVNFTIRTSFALLPLSGRCFFDKETGEEYPVDFFDPQTWIDNRLTPCLARPLPPLAKPSEPTGFFSGPMSSMAKALPTLRKNSLTSRPRGPSNANTLSQETPSTTKAGGIAAEPDAMDLNTQGASALTISNNNIDYSASHNGGVTSAPGEEVKTDEGEPEMPPSVSTTVTIPREKALAYLTRTLASVKAFKEALAHDPSHQAAKVYPPTAVVYGRNIPTVYGARVAGREGIRHADAYDALAFASGDGVVLAKAAMLPENYRVVRGGVVSSERGHVTLLGDLEAVGRCLNAVVEGRRRGVGLGRRDDAAVKEKEVIGDAAIEQ